MGNAIEQVAKEFARRRDPDRSRAGTRGRTPGRGQNKRVQDNDPIAHAEIDCLRNAGRLGSFRDTVLFSTLIPCSLCAGAVVQFGVRKVIVGDSRTFAGVAGFMRSHGAKLIDLDLQECAEMMTNFIAEHPQLWDEDIGR